MVSRVDSADSHAVTPRSELQERRATNDAALEQAEPANPPSAPFWETFTAELHAPPDEVFERLPEDGASEVDHYLYGAPKRRA